MTKLSVNINKIATLRNSRGNDVPNVLKVALDAEKFGADGITVHPRPDERHIKYKDVIELKQNITTELNVEGYPDQRFLELVKSVKPAQVTLVPDAPDALTSSAGWDCIKNQDKLKNIIDQLKQLGIRTSIFIDTDIDNITAAAKTGTDRIEFYTEPYAAKFTQNPEDAVKLFSIAAKHASNLGLGINAGHDLSLENLKFFAQNIENLDEVSIGHALIADAIYLGLENTIKKYKNCLK